MVGIVCFTLAAFAVPPVHAQNDPGPRPGPAAAGSFYSTLNANEQAFFIRPSCAFRKSIRFPAALPASRDRVSAQPSTAIAARNAMLSPRSEAPVREFISPQNAIAESAGSAGRARWRDELGSFIHYGERSGARGPLYQDFERRFGWRSPRPLHHRRAVRRSRAALWRQPDFATALSTDNIIFRTPTPLFGLGLVEATPDANLQANLAATHRPEPH